MLVTFAVTCIAIGALLIVTACISMEFSSTAAQRDTGSIMSILHANDIDFEDVYIMPGKSDSVSPGSRRTEGLLPEFQQYYKDYSGTAFAKVIVE